MQTYGKKVKMLSFKVIFMLAIGYFIKSVMSYNPMLTYTFRFKKITYSGNITVNYTINKIKENEFINGRIYLISEVPLDKVTVVFNRCSPEGVNCEYFQAWNLNSLCTIIQEKNQIWSSWYGTFDPLIVCPIKTLSSEIKNGYIDAGPAIRWYPDCTNYHWKVTQKFYALGNFAGSYTFHLSIFGYRKRNPRPSKN